jgi:hypothetical protein
MPKIQLNKEVELYIRLVLHKSEINYDTFRVSIG